MNIIMVGEEYKYSFPQFFVLKNVDCVPYSVRMIK
jgi:hypothetical protein